MKCKLCGQDFTPVHPKLSAVYCDDCRYSKERYDKEIGRKGLFVRAGCHNKW